MNTRQPRTSPEAGFTVVELVVAMVILLLVVGVIFNFTASKLVQSAIQSTRADLFGTAQLGLDRLANDIRLSSKADSQNRWADPNAPAAPGNEFSWQSGTASLVLATAAQDSSHNILFDDTKDYITTKNNFVYFVRDDTLFKRVLAAPADDNSAVTTCPAAEASEGCPADKVILTNVSDFSVRYFNSLNEEVSPSDARSIQLSVRLSEVRFGHDVSVNYTTRMVFRNG